MPVWLARSLGLAGGALKKMGLKQVPLTSFRLRNILTEYVYDLSPIMEVASPLPCDLETGVQRTVQWLQRVGEM
jgi:hypothetical protein